MQGGRAVNYAHVKSAVVQPLQEDALTRGVATASVGNLTWSLVESVPLVKEVACLVLGSGEGTVFRQ
jgi:hypothetical protein